MKNFLLTTLLSSTFAAAASAATISFNLLESAPAKNSSIKSNPESSAEVVMVDNYIAANSVANKPHKMATATTKKHANANTRKRATAKKHQPLRNAGTKKSHSAKYNQSYDVNAVFLQQQQQANQIILKSNQINNAAQQVARDAAIQAQKTQELLKAQKAAQASANATISSATQLNQLSLSLQKNLKTTTNLESVNSNLIESGSSGY